MLTFYTLGIRLYQLFLQLASPFSAKAKKWVEGRKNWAEILQAQTPTTGFDFWMHCSSLGEFEQGRPVLEAYRKQNPEASILLSFFSPSGFEIRKNYAQANHVQYLPIDTKENAQQWLQISRPKQIIFVKYDFWFNFLAAIKAGDYPSALISAHFPANHFFAKWPGKLWKDYLRAFQTIFFQQPPQLPLPNGIDQIISGDTRVDRVMAIQSEAAPNESIADWSRDHKVFIWGSVWPSDFALIQAALSGPLKSWKHIIAPHDPEPSMLAALNTVIAVKKQLLSAPIEEDNKVIIVDSVGQLASLYRYGSAAYIGGGFDKGIHNTLEPMAAGCPVVFGPKYHKFPEAVGSLEKKCGFHAEDTSTFVQITEQFNQDQFLVAAQQASRNYISSKAGATALILEYLNSSIQSPTNP